MLVRLSAMPPTGSIGPTLGPSIPELLESYRTGRSTPTDTARTVLAAIDARGADGIWISVADGALLSARAAELEAHPDPESLPLYGIPFGVKDSIDVAGWPTTLACPGYAYVATTTAPAVQRLLDAGAMLLGKTNLDQFATGLNGTRTPYTVPRSVFGGDLISGGSSSGSALAVALGEVPFTVATDTAGSGRVPPALNGVPGFKPSRGLISTVGLVPACRSLDCVSLIAGTVADLAAGLRRRGRRRRARPVEPRRGPPRRRRAALRLGLPDDGRAEFFGDEAMRAAHLAARAGLPALFDGTAPSARARSSPPARCSTRDRGWPNGCVEFGDFLDDRPGRLVPVVAEIIRGGARYTRWTCSARNTGSRSSKPMSTGCSTAMDVLVLPDRRHHVHRRRSARRPDRDEHELGHYTHFGNLLDLCAAAVPAGLTADGRPLSLMVLGPALADDVVLAVAARLEQLDWETVSATGQHPAA